MGDAAGDEIHARPAVRVCPARRARAGPAARPGGLADQFHGRPDGETVASFPNLGGDAVLVVPRPGGPSSAYAHLAAFIRTAPGRQAHELWRAVGAATEARLGAKPLWVSTAGMGVPWLHVRLDSRPKYYGYRLYAAG